MLKVTIDRQLWIRGASNNNSYLLRDSDNKMCCLGFACVAAGIPKKDINQVREPASVEGIKNIRTLEQLLSKSILTEEDRKENSRVCINLMMINDDPGINANEREYMIKQFGLEVNIDFEFIN